MIKEYRIEGKKLATSAVSMAKYFLGIPNKYRGGKATWSVEYWVKVVVYLGTLYKVKKSEIKRVKIKKGCYNAKPHVRIPSIRPKFKR